MTDEDFQKSAFKYASLYTAVQRNTPTPRQQSILNRAEKTRIEVNCKILSVFHWEGKGKSVLLLHGFHGNAGQMTEFVEPILEAGYSVTAFDAAGHGESTGDRTDVLEALDVISALEAMYGSFSVFIGHSFGSIFSLWALAHGKLTDKVIIISPPYSNRVIFDAFKDATQLPKELEQAVIDVLEKDWGTDMWERYSAFSLVKKVKSKALIIHDKDDSVICPERGGKELHKEWPGSSYIETKGLGHLKILRDRETIRSCVDFIKS